jgi:ATP-dependent Clp protease ATP-binding subunit ClpC
VLNVLLQIMDDGRLTDGHGRTVDFRNTIIIMTSNLGTSSDARGTFGFISDKTASKSERDKLRERTERALREFFRPEFLNRIDEVIVFEPLTEKELEQIVELMVDEVRDRLSDRQVELELTEAAKAKLVKEGYDPVFGARPLRRVVTRQVENPLSKRILEGEFQPGDAAVMDATDDGYSFARKEAVAARAG